MKEEKPEFFKLEESDRKVLAWLKGHVHPNAIRSWIEFIAMDYKRRKGVDVDVEKLFEETVMK
jgi:hypothetical protein